MGTVCVENCDKNFVFRGKKLNQKIKNLQTNIKKIYYPFINPSTHSNQAKILISKVISIMEDWKKNTGKSTTTASCPN